MNQLPVLNGHKIREGITVHVPRQLFNYEVAGEAPIIQRPLQTKAVVGTCCEVVDPV
eukprot:CAMPEP_0177532896 /NCGR_PEP_ID=MMETSP0369-20130122/54962_1 /TAXON_ID=447022 ORGANISM="Scrippsiella hangoei-like, Strain SHHI-4" /NCGR_SAMPLE_ID=MMETSP0369 /ASSEMBLY_ACC=CAM_ASM_000364 /LENGTH=56 /DNA_ID=CAMNT_0019014419 /DNA_START=135 /DNA_END=301 /DNA_ORIENTATION=+